MSNKWDFHIKCLNKIGVIELERVELTQGCIEFESSFIANVSILLGRVKI